MDSIIKKIEKLASLKKDMADLLQDLQFDSIAYNKFQELKNKLSGNVFEKIEKIYFGNDLKHVRLKMADVDCEFLPAGFFSDASLQPTPGSLFIFTNNDVGSALPGYISFRERNPHSIFVVWDWDSQHWTYMSCMLAIHSDFYISGGSENTYFLSHFSPNVLGPVYGGVYQWTREFILENIDVVLAERRNDPLGKHYFYANYPRRNRAIASVSKVFPSVCFGDNEYKKRSDLENFTEWCSYKTHWIMPVLGGVPLRAYNAMLTGGIPLLPSFLKNFPEVSIMGDLPLFYEVADLIDPIAIQEQAVKKFDSVGRSGLLQRMIDGLNRYHVDHRCEYILTLVKDEISKIRNSDRSYSNGYYKLPSIQT